MRADEALVRRAIALSADARAVGNHPFGALLAIDGAVVLEAQNTVATSHDPTAHAETNLVSDAIRQLTPEQIGRSVLYTSCEPCAMCAGKLYWAGVRSVVFALPATELAAMAGGDFLVPCRDLFARASQVVHVVGPVLADDAREVHRDYWPRRRA